jgi:hypothetical protein
MQCYRFYVINESVKKTKAFGRIALPEQMLPVLISWPSEDKERSGELALGLHGQPSGFRGLRQLNDRDIALFIQNRQKFEERYRKAIEETGPIAPDAEADLRYVINLAEAVAARSLKRLRNALAIWGRKSVDQKLQSFSREWGAIDSLAQRFNFRICKAHPCIWRSDETRRMVFGFYCPDIPTALHLLALEKAGGLGAISACKRCHRPVIGFRKHKEFCNDSCRAAYHVEQKRAGERTKKALKSQPEESHAKRSNR